MKHYLKYLPAVLPLIAAACAAAPETPQLAPGNAPVVDVPVAPEAAETVSPALSFVSVQPELFGVAGSLSNVWADFDRDGQLDLAVSLKGGAVRLYRQDDGVFTSVGEALGLPVSGPEFRGLSWGDYDEDGYPDLLAGATSPEELSRVFRNDAGTGFVDVSAELGLTIPGRSARQTNWIDYDNDGDLDVYSANRAGTNKLFENTGGVFAEVFVGEGPSDERPTVGACWFDYNLDGRLDLFLANQSGAEDAVWKNDISGFTDVASEAGIITTGRTKQEGGVGCAVGDFDNDGRLDIYFINYGANKLYRNTGEGGFEDVTEASGVADPDHAVGGDWGDFNNDGFLDLFVVGYEGPFGEQVPVNYLYLNDGQGGFSNILPLDHPINAGDHGVIWVDYDLDGALDLSLTDGYGPEGGHFVFRNELGAGTGLNVMVLNSAGLRVVPGAEVRLYDAAGDILATRLVHTGGGYNAQSAVPVHFGLKDAESVTVEVTFLTAQGRVTQKVTGVDPVEWAGKALVVQQE
ncbi:FG-GAP repeat protein [Hyphomonas neptunium ATCC 15444]|uniref:FG-GAP repeat protein n=2 Tax=Hyphomonas TaxID=85 RepID=Q0C5N8_HYPNA|nr:MULTISPECIES: CRTAC1 family protein [Hyphomonas]ABI76840.1 FG-GAP repeat protein [Hyphomonas neptunium ATCC 15444]KCZ95383.1 FG-GAP repeat-containing protein [Hyphomonas hirschiana VP5]